MYILPLYELTDDNIPQKPFVLKLDLKEKSDHALRLALMEWYYKTTDINVLMCYDATIINDRDDKYFDPKDGKCSYFVLGNLVELK